MNNIDDEMLSRVSSRTKTLKNFIKMPMVLLVVTAALLSGLTIVFLKLLTELAQSGNFINHIGLVVTLALSMGLAGFCQLHILNLAMKYYD